MNNDLKYKELTDAVICCFYNVYNALGYGFLEKVYENSLQYELTKRGISVTGQYPIPVYYDEKVVGEYFADLLVENSLIIEIKAAKSILPAHEAQLLNYLKATEIEVGFLLNFGPKPEIRRKVFDNTTKSANGTRINSDERR